MHITAFSHRKILLKFETLNNIKLKIQKKYVIKIVVEHTFGPKGFIRNIAKPLWNLPTHYLYLLQLKKRKSTCSILKTIINMNESQTHQNHHQQPTYVQTRKDTRTTTSSNVVQNT